MIPLRARLDVDVVTFARIVGADARSVRRWEAGLARPSGSSAAVIGGLTEALDRDPGVAVLLRTAGRIGLAYLIVRLAERQAAPITSSSPAEQSASSAPARASSDPSPDRKISQ